MALTRKWLADPENTRDWRVVKLLQGIPDWEQRRHEVDWECGFLRSADGLVLRDSHGNEISHSDVVIGTEELIGNAFALGAVDSTKGHSAALAGQAPNCPTEVDTVLRNKVTIGGSKDAVKYLGPAQAGIGLAVDLAVALGVIPEEFLKEVKIIVGVFVHWEAADNDEIFVAQFEGTFIAILRALGILPRDEEASHPFYPKPNLELLKG